MIFRTECSNTQYNAIEDLPKGQILGISLFDDAFFYDKNNKAHVNEEWMYGPFVFHASDVYRLDSGVKCSGKQEKWHCKKEIHQKIMSKPGVKDQIKKWKQKYGEHNLNFGEPTKTPIAITLIQPFAEAILSNKKKYENRNTRLFNIHPNIPLPDIPEMIQCRFCKNECTHWPRKKKKQKKRKRDNNSSLAPPKVMFNSCKIML